MLFSAMCRVVIQMRSVLTEMLPAAAARSQPCSSFSRCLVTADSSCTFPTQMHQTCLPAKVIDTMQHAGRFTLHLASLLLTHLSNMLPM